LFMGILFWKKKDEGLPLGLYGEKMAAQYLKKKGYQVIERNFKNPYGRRLGEIDIIAKKDSELVFVEVKTREIGEFNKVLPEENITRRKLHRLSKIARFYIQSKNLWDVSYRFDALSVWIDPVSKRVQIKHLENIFF
jgi:putative endonuclease